MDKAKEIATRKIGPLPLFAYVLIGAGLLFFLRGRAGGGAIGQPSSSGSAGGGPGIPPWTPTDPGLGTSPGDGLPVPGLPGPPGLPGLPGPPGPPGQAPVPIIPTPTTPSLSATPITSPSGGPIVQTGVGGLSFFGGLTGGPAASGQFFPSATQNGEAGFIDPQSGVFIPGSQFPGFETGGPNYIGATQLAGDTRQTAPIGTISPLPGNSPMEPPPPYQGETTTNDPQFHSYYGPAGK